MLIKQLAPAARQQLATVQIDAPLTAAAMLMQGKLISLVVVCNKDGTIAGVITKTDIVKQIGSCIGNSCRAKAAGVMTPEVVFCKSDVTVNAAWSLIKSRGLKHIPIADDNGRPIGVLYARQLIQALLDEVCDEEALLRDYISGVGYQ